MLKKFNSGLESYDHIADNSQRSDEEIKLILSRMKKQGLIGFDGETATITEKGKMCIAK